MREVQCDDELERIDNAKKGQNDEAWCGTITVEWEREGEK